MDRHRCSPLRVEALEPRDVPSAAAEDVYSLPHLDGMSARYPTDVQPAATPTDAETVTVDGTIGRPLKALPRARFAVGSGPGRTAQVNVYDSATNAIVGILTPFGRDFTGGARVATADLTGDGIEDIVVGAGPGGAPSVKVYDGATLNEERSFLAYGAAFGGGVFVAAGDVTGDGRADLVTGAGAGGGPHVRVFDGKELMKDASATPAAAEDFFAYDPAFHGGVSVAVGDVDGDGRAEVVTGAGPGGGPHVEVFGGKDHRLLASFFAYDPAFTGGVFVAAGDLDGDGRADIATGPMAGGGPHVRVFDGGGTPGASYCPFDGSQRCGAAVAVADVDGDGRAELIAASGPGVAPEMKVLHADSGAEMRDFPAMTPDYVGGLFVG